MKPLAIMRPAARESDFLLIVSRMSMLLYAKNAYRDDILTFLIKYS
jgi:hypothetical protein